MIRALDEVMESRLTWPESKPRAARRERGPFRSEVAKATREIDDELGRWHIRQWIISRNNQRIYGGDPGAAVWWLDRRGQLRVLACDRWETLSSNLHAIALTLGAMRALERWGAYTAEQAAEGARPALPPPATPPGPPWWEILGVGRDWPLEAIEAIYKAKAEKTHPDRGGSAEAMAALNEAVRLAREERRA